jgi:hypothetical protein
MPVFDQYCVPVMRHGAETGGTEGGGQGPRDETACVLAA